jgi:hypothetical protein
VQSHRFLTGPSGHGSVDMMLRVSSVSMLSIVNIRRIQIRGMETLLIEAGQPRFDYLREPKYFSSPPNADQFLGLSALVQFVQRGQAAGYGAACSLCIEAEKVWSYASTPLSVFMAWC